jgi:hypothetical protein
MQAAVKGTERELSNQRLPPFCTRSTMGMRSEICVPEACSPTASPCRLAALDAHRPQSILTTKLSFEIRLQFRVKPRA